MYLAKVSDLDVLVMGIIHTLSIEFLLSQRNCLCPKLNTCKIMKKRFAVVGYYAIVYSAFLYNENNKTVLMFLACSLIIIVFQTS